MLCRCVDIWCVCEELMVEPHPLVEVLQYSSLKVVMHSNYTMYWFLSWTATFMLTQCIVLWSQTVVMDTCCRRGASYSGEKVTWYPLFVLAWTTPWFHGVSCSSFSRTANLLCYANLCKWVYFSHLNDACHQPHFVETMTKWWKHSALSLQEIVTYSSVPAYEWCNLPLWCSLIAMN